jgi:alcohol dehydrogenase, propanol-preferring
MRAAVVRDFHQPLAVEDRPIPEPGAEQVLVRIETCGLCHTDIHAARGDWPVKPLPPFVPGHEGVGIVEYVGPGNAHGLEQGMRVALPWLGYACGDCTFCNSGRETLCKQQRNTGYAIDGGFAEYAVGNARHVVRVPDGIDPLDASPLTCAGVTTYKAVKVAGTSSADLVAIFGVGGLGHLAIQYALISGAIVVGVDVEDAKLALATELGADVVVDAREGDPVEAIRDLGGLDVAIALATSSESFEQAFRALRRGGRLICVALPADGEMRLPIFDTVLGGLSVIGSIVGTRADLADVFDLHAAGRTRVIARTRKLDEVNDAIDDVLGGRVPARLVLEF